jgi:hypothetical protein
MAVDAEQLSFLVVKWAMNEREAKKNKYHRG